MSIESSIVSTVKKSGTITVLKESLPVGMTDAQERDLWQRWGRKQFSQRLLNTACMVITNAIYGETTPWKFVNDQCAKGGKQNTMFHLVEHFSRLCFENDWPYYGVLIVDRTGYVPKGFWKFYFGSQGTSSPEDQQVLNFFEDRLRNECFKDTPPTAHEIALAVANYVHTHGL